MKKNSGNSGRPQDWAYKAHGTLTPGHSGVSEAGPVYKKGDRVWHNQHGAGNVQFFSTRYKGGYTYGVKFDAPGTPYWEDYGYEASELSPQKVAKRGLGTGSHPSRRNPKLSKAAKTLSDLRADALNATYAVLRAQVSDSNYAKLNERAIKLQSEYQTAKGKKRNPRKTAIRWQDMKLSPDQNIGGAGSSWYVFSRGDPVSQHGTRAEAETHFRRIFPGKPLHVWDGNRQKWSGEKPPGVYTWAEVDAAKAKQEGRKP